MKYHKEKSFLYKEKKHVNGISLFHVNLANICDGVTIFFPSNPYGSKFPFEYNHFQSANLVSLSWIRPRICPPLNVISLFEHNMFVFLVFYILQDNSPSCIKLCWFSTFHNFEPKHWRQLGLHVILIIDKESIIDEGNGKTIPPLVNTKHSTIQGQNTHKSFVSDENTTN